jgi:hypothetical protein
MSSRPKLLDPPPDLAGLTAGPRQQISAVLDKLTALTSVRDELARKAEVLRREIPRAENRVNPLDDAAVEKLQAKKHQLLLVEKRLGEFDAREPEIEAGLADPIHEARGVFERVIQREYKALVERIAETLIPFCYTPEAALNTARSLPLAQDYESALGRWAPYGVGNIELARRALTAFNALTESCWPWPPA